jgi:hypothetical protein
MPDEWVVRRIERAPLGTPYTKIVERIAALTEHPKLRGNCRLVVDATGLGAPVVDMLRAARLGCETMPVVMTSGTEEHFDGRVWRVPKIDLLARVQMLLEQDRLRVAKAAKERAGLVKELLDVRAKQMGRGHMRVGADGNGQHDDLVMAVALACWMDGAADQGKAGTCGVSDGGRQLRICKCAAMPGTLTHPSSQTCRRLRT